jgi:hypothetical protein
MSAPTAAPVLPAPPATVDPERVAAILRSAADQIAERGLWRGGPWQHTTGHPTCTALAIGAATGTYCADLPWPERSATGDAAFTTLADHLGLDASPQAAPGDIINWNDHADLADPQAEVCAALHAAAARALNGGAS